MAHPLKSKYAIAGLGLTPKGKVYDTPVGFAVDAVRLALDDAGLARDDLDGLLVNPGLAWMEAAMGSFSVQQAMGLEDIRWSASMNLGGATAAAMIMHAAHAIDAGLATTVACVFSDAPLKPPKPAADGKKSSGGSGAAYGFARGLDARLRPVRRERDVRAGRAAPHASLRHDERPPRRRRGRAARLGEPEPARAAP